MCCINIRPQVHFAAFLSIFNTFHSIFSSIGSFHLHGHGSRKCPLEIPAKKANSTSLNALYEHPLRAAVVGSNLRILNLKRSHTPHEIITRLQPNCLSHCTKQYTILNINTVTDSEFCSKTWQWFAMGRVDDNQFVLQLQIHLAVVQSCYVSVRRKNFF